MGAEIDGEMGGEGRSDRWRTRSSPLYINVLVYLRPARHNLSVSDKCVHMMSEDQQREHHVPVKVYVLYRSESQQALISQGSPTLGP